MDAVDGRTQIHRARAHRIAGATGHEARQIGLTLDHLGRRMPIRPLGLAGDLLHAGPGEAIAADTDAVAHGTAATQHVIEVGVRRIDDQRAGGLLGRERNFLTAQMGRQLRRADFRLLFRRQRGQHQRLAIGAHDGLLRLYGAGNGGSAADAFRRTQAIFARIDNAGRGNAAIATV